MAGIKERLIQVVLRGKDLLSGEAGKSAAALDALRETGEQLQASLARTDGAAKLARQLDQTRVTTERAQIAYGKAQEEVARLREEMAAAPRGQLEASLKSAEQNARKAATEVRSLRKELAERPDDAGVARDLAQAERLAGEARAEVERLRTELVNAPTNTGLVVALKEAERAARASGRELDQLRDAERDLERQAREAGIATENLGAEQDRLQRETDEARRAIKENADALDELRRKQAAAAAGAAEHASRVSAAREVMSNGMRTVLGFAAAYVSLDAAIGLAQRGVDALRAGIGNMLQAGDDAEALQARMSSLMGSIAEGKRATDWIGDFAKQTPMATAEVADAFMLLKAYGLDPMDGTLRALVDKNEQLGGGMERLEGIVTAVGQAYAKSKLQTEEILQLVERGVPAWDLLSKVTGKNAAQLEKLASEGRLGRDVVAALVAELGKSAEGAAADGMSRLSGLMSQLSDSAKDFYKRIAEAGALDYVKGKLQGVLATIKAMDENGRLDKLAKALSDAFIQGAERVENFARKLAGVDFQKLTDDSSAWLSNFGQKLDEMATSVQLFVAPFRTLFNGVTSGLSALGATFTGTWGLMLGAIEAVADKIPDVLGGAKLKAGVSHARQILNGLRDGFVAQIEQDGQDIRNAWDTTNNHLTQSSKAAASAQTAVHKSALEQQRMLDQAHADHLVANQRKAKDAAIAAAVDGTKAIADMGQALQLIDTARTVQQIDGLRGALLKAYQGGQLGIEQYQQATGVLNARLAEVKKGAADLQGSLRSVSDAAVEGAQRSADAAKQSSAESAAVHKSALEQQRMLDQAHADHLVANQQRVKDAAIAAAVDGTKAIADMAQALQLIDTARTVQQIDGLRGALLKAYQGGQLGIEQYQQATGVLNARLAEVKKEAAGAQQTISDLSEEFENLADVQQAIASAQTDVDINKIKKALRELYEAGTITAAEYNQELLNVTAKQKELKGAVEQTAQAGQQAGEELTRSQQMYNEALEDSILTNEELRRISGQRMEEERRASGELMEMQRQGQVVVERDMSAMEGFFGGVMSRAREPLAAMSSAALALFDRLRGIKSVDLGIDTSGLDATRTSLGRVSDELANVQAALNTVGLSGFSKFALESSRASLQAQQAYLGQKASLQSLMERYESGSMSLRSFISAAKGAASGLSLLDQSDLSSLESAIASAEQRMQALGDSTRNTLEGLQSELDQLRGNEEAVEARRFAQRKRELQMQLEEARASGSDQAVADLTRAMSVLREVQAETEQQRINKAFQERQQPQQQAAPPAAQPQPQQPTTVIRLEASRGQRVDVSVPQGQQTQLLEILAEAGLRSL